MFSANLCENAKEHKKAGRRSNRALKEEGRVERSRSHRRLANFRDGKPATDPEKVPPHILLSPDRWGCTEISMDSSVHFAFFRPTRVLNTGYDRSGMPLRASLGSGEIMYLVCIKSA
jgi:hypothetical protein